MYCEFVPRMGYESTILAAAYHLITQKVNARKTYVRKVLISSKIIKFLDQYNF